LIRISALSLQGNASETNNMDSKRSEQDEEQHEDDVEQEEEADSRHACMESIGGWCGGMVRHSVLIFVQARSYWRRGSVESDLKVRPLKVRHKRKREYIAIQGHVSTFAVNYRYLVRVDGVKLQVLDFGISKDVAGSQPLRVGCDKSSESESSDSETECRPASSSRKGIGAQ
jgi:hypothetical protein